MVMRNSILNSMKIIINCLILLFSQELVAQKIIRSALSSYGNSVASDGFVLKQTIGQPSNTTSFKDGSGSVFRQGFQQSSCNKIVKNKLEKCNMSIVPNPNRGEFTISLEQNDALSAISINDVRGNQVFNQTIHKGSASMHLNFLKSGVYIVYIKTNKDLVCNQKLLILD
jgi:hypothetical protein